MITVKKLTVKTFTSDGVGILAAVLTLRKPMKLSKVPEKAKLQLIKKLPKLNTPLFKHANFTVEYPGDGIDNNYQFLFSKLGN